MKVVLAPDRISCRPSSSFIRASTGLSAISRAVLTCERTAAVSITSPNQVGFGPLLGLDQQIEQPVLESSVEPVIDLDFDPIWIPQAFYRSVEARPQHPLEISVAEPQPNLMLLNSRL